MPATPALNMYLVEMPNDVAQLDVMHPENLAFVTQTTLSVDDTACVIDSLRQRFPRIQGPRKDDICYATQNRQDAVKALAGKCDVFLVVGSPNSSNSNRLREIAEKQGIPAYLVDEANEILEEWVAGQAEYRRDRRCFRAAGAGRRRGRAAARLGRGSGGGVTGTPGASDLFPAAGAAVGSQVGGMG